MFTRTPAAGHLSKFPVFVVVAVMVNAAVNISEQVLCAPVFVSFE